MVARTTQIVKKCEPRGGERGKISEVMMAQGMLFEAQEKDSEQEQAKLSKDERKGYFDGKAVALKMIYNGKWTGTTCANGTINAQVTTSAFNGTSSTYQQVVRVGYTYNSSYASNSTTSRTLATLFGTNDSDSNTASSNIKTYIENTWFSNIGNYESILEASAGYCGDRTVYDTSNVLQAESLSIPQYSTSTTRYNFGAKTRNMTTAQSPSLTCAKYDNGTTSVDRSRVDLYSVSGASTGNGRLAKPAALLTADEASFAGSGSSIATNGSSYNSSSFLRSGSGFWLLSPNDRSSGGYASGFVLSSGGYLSSIYVYSSYGVRPAISLIPGTEATSGTGTATDPWVV